MQHSKEDETKYIEKIGTHRMEVSPFTKEELLEQYVEAHKLSKHKHHREGVAYAKKKLRDIRREWSGK